VALLFGSEKYGLSNEALSHCHWLMRIATRDEHISMNLGQAVAVCLYELVRDAKATARAAKTKQVRAGEVERISGQLFEALEKSGYVNPRSAAATREKVRRMVLRLALNRDDAELLLGMLRQILWKIDQSNRPGGADAASSRSRE
jgi:tRNA/rRNA methyltransferase